MQDISNIPDPGRSEHQFVHVPLIDISEHVPRYFGTCSHSDYPGTYSAEYVFVWNG